MATVVSKKPDKKLQPMARARVALLRYHVAGSAAMVGAEPGSNASSTTLGTASTTSPLGVGFAVQRNTGRMTAKSKEAVPEETNPRVRGEEAMHFMATATTNLVVVELLPVHLQRHQL